MNRIFVLFFLLLSVSLYQAAPLAAQSATQLQQVQQELTKRGLTEAEVRTRLIQNGIDIDRIPPSELPQYQTRIIRVIEQLEAEKKAAAAMQIAVADTARTPDDQRVTEAAAEAAQRVVQESLEERDIYGHGLFTNQSLDVFRTTDGARAPDTYILGAGDQIRVTIFGTSQADMLLEINDEGYIQPTGMPKIFMQGVTLERARALLRQRFSSYYTFRSEEFAVTIQTARTITVNVFGESMLKGSFTISALNTAFNALAAAGGPTAIGSVRNIQVIRGAQRKTLDVYAFMNDPAIAYQFDLQHNDIIYVPVARKLVRVSGAVNRPMRYELTDNETLADLINLAGGISADAYPDFVQIERFVNGEVRLQELALSAVLTGSQRVDLQNGDLIRIRRITPDIEQQVSSAGSVYYPGRFSYETGMTVADLLKQSGGLKPSASEVAYVVRRELSDSTRAQYFPVNVNQREDQLFPLQPNDRLTVYDQTLYSLVGEIRITGAIKNNRELTYDPSLTLADVFRQAGGFETGAALNRVEVFRTTIYPDRENELELITLQIDSTYTVTGGDDLDFRLHPYDQIVVRRTPGFTLSRTVEVNGEVNYPGVYVLEARNINLSEIIEQAGGLRAEADPAGSLLFRTFKNRGYVVTNAEMAMQRRGDLMHDPILFEGDIITIPRRENTISIRRTGTRYFDAFDPGLADNSLDLTYQGAKSAAWYIKNFAGGFEKEADRFTVTVTLKNGQVKSTKRVLYVFRTYPKVEPGSTVSVRLKPQPLPGEEKKVDWDMVFNRTMQTTTTLLTMLILIDRL